MKRILWIDDDYKLLRALGQELSRSGIEVQFAEDIATAIEAIIAAPFDLVIVDANLRSGDLKDRFPAVADQIPPRTAGAGVYFAQMLATGSEAFPALPRVLICSSFDKSHLAEMAPGVAHTLPYLSKSDAFLDSRGFCQRIETVIQGNLEQGRQDEGGSGRRGAPPESSKSERLFEELFHDIRNNIVHNIPVLNAVSNRLQSLIGGQSKSTFDYCVAFERAANQALEELSEHPKVNWDLFDGAEALRQRLHNDLTNFSISKLSMIGDVVRHLAEKLQRLPPTASYWDVKQSRLNYDLHLSRMEITSVVDNIVAALTENTPGHADGEADAFDTSQVLRSLVAMEELSALHRGVEFQSTIEDGLVLNHGRRAAYRRLMASLVENAVKYTEKMQNENAWIEVRHYLRDADIVTEIESWGPPVLRAEQMVVFDRGRRGVRANRPGTGLGLAIARDEAAGFGGQISIQSKEKAYKGQRNVQTTVKVVIPRDPPSGPRTEDT